VTKEAVISPVGAGTVVRHEAEDWTAERQQVAVQFAGGKRWVDPRSLTVAG